MQTDRQTRPRSTDPTNLDRIATARRGTSPKAHEHADSARRRPRRGQRRTTSSATAVTAGSGAEQVHAAPVPNPRRSALGTFFGDLNLVKCFTLFGFTVALVHVLLFSADLAFGWPLQRVSPLYDVTYVVCGVLLGCLCWGVFREQVRESR